MPSLSIRDDLANELLKRAESQGLSVDDVLATLLAIGKQHEDEAVLLESETRLSDLIEQAMVGTISSAMDAVIAIDEDERIVVFNHAAEQMFACPIDEALGQPLGRFLPEQYRTAHSAHIRHFGKTGETTRSMHSLKEVTGLRATGEEFPTEATISQVTVQGTKFYSVILRDITERKQTEALRLENETMRVALEKEKELIDLKGRFLSTVSHEFRTPLAMIITSTELLDRFFERMTEERRKECVTNVLTQANEMVLLMNDVLVFNKAAAGKLQFRPGEINLKTLLQSILEQLQPTYDPELHRIVIENDEQVGTLWGDEELLKRVFINLLSNAIKYSPQGGDVRFMVQRHGSEVIFRVSDKGIGIPLADQEHLFEPFHRAANTGDIHGTGLGLSIVREFVWVHGGDTIVESQEGKGTTVTVSLPMPRN